MSKLFYLLVIVIMAAAKMIAQEKAALYTTGTHFILPVEKEQWQNTNTDNFTRASYKWYNGQTYIMIVSNRDATIQLDYTAIVKKGKLLIEVANTNHEIIYEATLTTDKKDMGKLDLKANEVYHITFTGKQTSGSYECKWKTL